MCRWKCFGFCYLHGWEKLSEVFKSFARTFPAPGGQLCIVSRFRKAEPSVAKRTRITIETDSLLILRSRSSRRAWCPRCVTEADMIALDEAGVISNLQRQALEEWLNSEELHRTRAPDGSTLICLNSLLARVQKT
jgi:hypothetical protein